MSAGAADRADAVGEYPHFFLIAGEMSGDLLGSRLMAALDRETAGRARYSGIGGLTMGDAGLKSLFPMAELSVMGIAEVLPKIPRLARRLRQTMVEIDKSRPDAVITIDSPGFNFRVAKRLLGQPMARIHYVAPSVWAWRGGRAREAARLFDRLLALLPFEPPYFEVEGMRCDFVGHPVVESGAAGGDGTGFRKRHGIDAACPLVCVLPGSRHSEAARLLPVFGRTVQVLARSRPGLRVVVPAAEAVADEVTAAVARWMAPSVVVRGAEEKFDAFAAADVALAASGTVALELAMAATPAVIAYRMNPLSAIVARRLIKVRYANLVNIILNHEAVPEFLQDRCRPDVLSRALDRLLGDADARARQVAAGRDVLGRLGLGGTPPSTLAARAVMETLSRPPRKINGGTDGRRI